MECLIIEKKDFSVARCSGSIEKNVPFLIRDIVHSGFDGRRPRVILDVERLDDGGDMTAQLAVMTAFNKEVRLRNGSLKICSLQPRITSYLVMNGLDRLFDTYENLEGAEKSPWKRKEHGEKRRNHRTAA